MRLSGAFVLPLFLVILAGPAPAADSVRSRGDGLPLLLQGGRACATPDPKALSLERLLGDPTDCSFTATSIEAQYDPVNGKIFIPTVVHVIHSTGGSGNITDPMIESQIDILNEDFLALAGTPGEDGTDAQIEFVLAGVTRTPNNTWFTGIASESNEIAAKEALSGDWSPSVFLNLYTAQPGGGILGWATFPQDPCAFTSLPSCSAGHFIDGVVILWSAFGRNSPLPPFDQGRTATHEVGHWLGLFHTFQDDGGSGCGSDTSPVCFGERDLICDTPSEAGPNFNVCPPAAVDSCNPSPDGGNDPIENYMDYSEDACMSKFTVEQSNRARCAVANYRLPFRNLVFADGFGTQDTSRWTSTTP
jgi:hypothetical protein